ncbi:acyl--CoA ligase [Rhodococcus rhodochrous]|uniref:class I adenylate-forming enzyme family protein n=1 Tax=Rhodococcus rhodochrous TaxID=1829 RepID=UPI000750FC50|nr:class I adenylate-forming enzyme family protein [Rhodococcus rhodochrous]MDO1486857.1 acyl--CoA ligase [Rhodococcus rhodochrous]
MKEFTVTQRVRADTVGKAPEDHGDLYAGFQTVALAAPHAPAVIRHDGTTSSYEALLDAVDAAAERLTAELHHGDVLGLAVEDPFTFVALYLAAAKLNVVTVLLDSQLSAQEREHSAAKYDLGMLAVDHGRLGRPGSFLLEPVPDADLHRARSGYAPEDFVVHCTSGSTGKPKGIVMSQEAITARIRLWGSELDLTHADVVLCALPLSHCHGIDVLTLPTLLSGATVVFAQGSQLTGRGLARCIETHGITVMSGLPVMYQMLTAARGVPAMALRTLRLAISGSAPLRESTQKKFLEQYGLPLRQVYGLSEIAIICFDKAYVGNGSIGLPIAGVEYRLESVSDDDAESDHVHELYVRGPGLARGYYRDPDATAEMFEDGWLRTRDLVLAEPDGWYILGRQSTFINVAGNKVGPLEVEAALRQCSGVLDCAVVGVTDSRSTEQIAALLVTGQRFDLSTVRRQLGELLLSYQLPQRYEIAAALPRTPLGKTDYAAVRQRMHTDYGEGK